MKHHEMLAYRRNAAHRHLREALARVNEMMAEIRHDLNAEKRDFLFVVQAVIDNVCDALDEAGSRRELSAVVHNARVALQALRGTAFECDIPLMDALEDVAIAADPLPWKSTDHRDENARLLAEATHRLRFDLRREAPDVPMQGYELLPAEVSPSGALAVGQLITLRTQSSMFRGGCPVCAGLALGMAVGGDGTTWFVFGVCTVCAHVLYRSQPRAEFFEEMGELFDTLGFVSLTSNQWLGMNGHAHDALLAELRKRGAALLPPPHFGFLVAMPETMCRWHNDPLARASGWAIRVAVRHASTGALVQLTEQVQRQVTAFVSEYQLRTGRLPELEHEGADGLLYCFPMISQEPVEYRKTPAIEDAAPWTSARDDAPAGEVEADFDTEADTDSEAEQAQADIDLVVDTALDGMVHRSALERVTTRLDETGALDDAGAGELAGLYLSADVIADGYDAIDDDQLREAMELRAKTRITPTHRLAYLREYILGELEADADASHALVPVTLTARDGRTVLVVGGVRGYSFSGVETTWCGPFATVDAMRRYLTEEGWVQGVEGFEALSPARRLAIATRNHRKTAR